MVGREGAVQPAQATQTTATNNNKLNLKIGLVSPSGRTSPLPLSSPSTPTGNASLTLPSNSDAVVISSNGPLPRPASPFRQELFTRTRSSSSLKDELAIPNSDYANPTSSSTAHQPLRQELIENALKSAKPSSSFHIIIPPYVSTPPRVRSPTHHQTQSSNSSQSIASVRSTIIAALHTYTRDSKAFLLSLRSSDLWLILWFCVSASLPIYNKALLRGFFPFPFLLTANQMLCSSMGTWCAAKAGVFRPSRLSVEREKIIWGIAALYSAEILTSNLGLRLVNVPFHLSVRALSPAISLCLGYLFFKEKTSFRAASCLSLLMFGVLFTSHGLELHSSGSILTITSTLLLAAKVILTREVLQLNFGMHPLDILSRTSLLGMAHCAIFALWNGELRRLWHLSGSEVTKHHFAALVGNGTLAFALFVVGLLAEKRMKTSSMAIGTHAAQAVTTATSVLVWGLPMSIMNFLGVALTLTGGVLYAKYDDVDSAEHESNVRQEVLEKQQSMGGTKRL
ncbi:hypothetical protein T439DRAFT_304697 [Meredithblackwellia eburnea MCA 4105]